MTCFAKEGNEEVLEAMEYTEAVMGVKRNNSSQNPAKSKKSILKVTSEDYISAEPFIQNLFYIIDHTFKEGSDAWKHVCIGSDLDGIIDPIDICPTASHFPHFKERLKQFIPIYFEFRKMNVDKKSVKLMENYFNETFTLSEALDLLFYDSLKEFTIKHLKGK